MAMSVTYVTVHGRLREETRGGVTTRYLGDTLGSVIKTTDTSGNVTSTTTYWPFGEVRSQTGTNPSPWGFCGVWGYLTDAVSRMYVRARHYRADTSRWLIVDPLWPHEPAYQYASDEPLSSIDPAGTLPFLVIFALIVAGALTCAVAARLLYDYFAHKVYPHPMDHYGHCIASCLISYYLPLCKVFTPFATECIGEFDWDDVLGNAWGFKCGDLIRPLPIFIAPPLLILKLCEGCCNPMRRDA